jgi:hypothetical protein
MMVAIIATAMATTMIPRILPTRVSSRWSGVVSAGASFIMPAMRPICVRMPVAVTTARPRPYVAAVPLKIMLWRSPTPTSSPIGSTCFATGRLSPVRAASAVWSAVEWISRASAAIVSPSSTSMMSPGTTSAAATLRCSPSRTTRAWAADICRKAATA